VVRERRTRDGGKDDPRSRLGFYGRTSEQENEHG
jgi:hypothetical protein